MIVEHQRCAVYILPCVGFVLHQSRAVHADFKEHENRVMYILPCVCFVHHSSRAVHAEVCGA